MPERIQLKRTKGWRMPENTVKVDRTTRWGNPYTISAAREAGYQGTDVELAQMCVAMFRAWQSGSEAIVARWPPSTPSIQSELRGKNLACWCPLDKPCHADVLLELANQTQNENVPLSEVGGVQNVPPKGKD